MNPVSLLLAITLIWCPSAAVDADARTTVLDAAGSTVPTVSLIVTCPTLLHIFKWC
ncbi:hypothetical protein [uncultured Bifidobacterium sp.]|uniref:hypothetical protein n=1 Tax=uncultured Bifidobacterium sp. TaxID=165187 RepID=UPI00262307E9|nr:hypothetical protein [uncultured Bifidobacterium sp.]